MLLVLDLGNRKQGQGKARSNKKEQRQYGQWQSLYLIGGHIE